MRRLSFSRMPGALVIGIALLTTTPALSQSDQAGIEAAQKADELFRSGKELYKAGKVQEAYDAYHSAWGFKHTYDIAANLANVEVLLGKKGDAARHLAFCVRNFPPSGGKAQLERIKARLEEIRKNVGALTIKVNIEGAEILVDGVSMGRAPIAEDVYVDPGARTIEARLAGYEPVKQAIQVSAGPAQTVTLTLVSAVPPPGPTGTVAPPPPPANTGEVPPPSPWKPGIGLVVGAGVLAAGGLAAGAGLTAAANGKASNAAELSSKIGGGKSACSRPAASAANDCKALSDAVGSKNTLSNAAVAGFVAGGAFALVTAGLGVWAASSPKTTSVRVAPVVGAGDAGVVVQGAW